MRRLLVPIRVRKAFVLSADYLKGGNINVTMPGGENFMVRLPDWEKIKKLPGDMPLIQRIAIAYGFKKASLSLKVLAYDFESVAKGISPNPEIDRALSVSFWGDNYASVFKSDNPAEVIKFFVDVVNKVDPDILAGYFANRYDILLAMNEAERYNIPLSIGRDGKGPEIVFRRFDSSDMAGDRFKVKFVNIAGRLHFDVFDEVIYDQSTIGIKGHGLKDVAKFLKIPHVIEVDRKAVTKLTNVELMDYNLSDARLTYVLAKTYLMNMIQLCESLDLPMNLVMSRTPSHVPNYIYGRDFLERNIEYEGDNQTRFPDIFAPGKKKCYQGGYVDLFKTGIFKPVTKIDFVNLYPGIMAMLNADPYTVELVSIGPFTDSPPAFYNDKITFSDKIVGDVTIRIDLSHDSATRKQLIKFIKQKAEFKPLAKKNPLAKSQYWVVKLVMNALSGYHGLRYAKWGNVLVIMVTTALGRWFLKTVCDIEPGKIEADTDGVYLGGRLSEKDVRSYEKIIRDLIPEKYLSEFIGLDADYYRAGLFLDEKNYVLETEEGDLLFHGAGLKGKHLPIVCDNALQKLIHALFAGKEWRAILPEITKMPEDIGDFVMKASFNKVGYEGNSLYAQLEKQLKAHNIDINVGDTARYVKTKGGYSIIELAERVDIDEEYYLKRIADILARALKPIETFKSKEMREIMKTQGGL